MTRGFSEITFGIHCKFLIQRFTDQLCFGIFCISFYDKTAVLCRTAVDLFLMVVNGFDLFHFANLHISEGYFIAVILETNVTFGRFSEFSKR
jgi:hypothetical protein